MDDRQARDAAARNRWLVINLLRLVGVAMVILGILIVRGRIGQPDAVGFVLLALGLADIFFVPTLLARKWRTPPS